MRRFITIILSIIIASSCMFGVSSVSSNYVFAEAVTVNAGDSITIPVKISNNQGIMGFRITVSYDNKTFSAYDVTRGTVTKTGMFNDSITSSTQNSFDVLWTGTSCEKDDGSLFNIAFQVSPNAKTGEYSINLSYDQNDTFDDNWNDVDLNTTSVKVNVKNSETENPDPQPRNNRTVFQKIADFIKRVIQFIKNIFK